MFDKDYEFVHLSGSWARERHIEKMPLTRAGVYVDSKRMVSGHSHSPFMALARPNTTEKEGEDYEMCIRDSRSSACLQERWYNGGL